MSAVSGMTSFTLSEFNEILGALPFEPQLDLNGLVSGQLYFRAMLGNVPIFYALVQIDKRYAQATLQDYPNCNFLSYEFAIFPSTKAEELMVLVEISPMGRTRLEWENGSIVAEHATPALKLIKGGEEIEVLRGQHYFLLQYLYRIRIPRAVMKIPSLDQAWKDITKNRVIVVDF